MFDFDDSRLDDAAALAEGDAWLRPLAEAGARLRREASAAWEALTFVESEGRPRAVVAVGPEARLLRAIMEPTCPVPFVAWSNLGLPGWVGPLDLVVVLGEQGPRPAVCVREALRRGSRLVVSARPGSDLAEVATSRLATVLPSTTSDPLCRAIVALQALQRLGLGEPVDTDAVASAMDAVATDSSHRIDISSNQAKMLALELADFQPLVWGGSVLAARASRRIAESIRAASGRIALAADAAELIPIVQGIEPRDPFADPFEQTASDRRPSLVVVDDGRGDAAAAESLHTFERYAASFDVRLSHLRCTEGTDLVRYVTVLQRGRFSAAYLAVGLGRPAKQ